MAKKNDDSIKKVQSLDWDDSEIRRPTRRGYIIQKWFEFQREITEDDYYLKGKTS